MIKDPPKSTGMHAQMMESRPKKIRQGLSSGHRLAAEKNKEKPMISMPTADKPFIVGQPGTQLFKILTSKLQPKITVEQIRQVNMKLLQMSGRAFPRRDNFEFIPETGELILAIKVRMPFLHRSHNHSDDSDQIITSAFAVNYSHKKLHQCPP